MNYNDAVLYLNDPAKRGIKNPQAVLKEALKPFGSPEDHLRVIHIAGTNGKGSTAAMLSSVLGCAGYKTGVFTSPHLERINERITLGGLPISDDDFASVLTRVTDANISITFSFFELLTLAAFVYFFERNADCAVVETGIGGRLDSTNIVAAPVLSVITRVDIDHTRILGETIAEIAAEKAGIIKRNSPVVLCANTKEVREIVEQACEKMNAPLYEDMPQMDARFLTRGEWGMILSARAEGFFYKDLRLNLFAPYQIENAAGVLAALHALNQNGMPVSQSDIREGFANVSWPCRMEILCEKPLIVADGAHNPSGARSLTAALGCLEISGRVIFVAAVQLSKSPNEIISIFSCAGDAVILTEAGASFAKAADVEADVLYIADYREALDKALSLAGKDDCICIAGSLYLAGAARALLLGRMRKGNPYA